MKASLPQVFLFLAVIISCQPAVAQVVLNDLGTHSNVINSRIENKVDRDYNNTQGRYLWSKEWNPALVTMKAGNVVKMKAVKLNLYTSQIHYPSGPDEMAASIDNVKKIVLYSNNPADSTTIVGTFEVINSLTTSGDGSKKDFFYEVMNDGKIQLLRRIIVGAKKLPPEPLISSSEKVQFYSNSDFMIRSGAEVKTLKTLNTSNVLEAVPVDSQGREWLSANKNKLKKEEDVAAFFNYLNSQSK